MPFGFSKLSVDNRTENQAVTLRDDVDEAHLNPALHRIGQIDQTDLSPVHIACEVDDPQLAAANVSGLIHNAQFKTTRLGITTRIVDADLGPGKLGGHIDRAELQTLSETGNVVAQSEIEAAKVGVFSIQKIQSKSVDTVTRVENLRRIDQRQLQSSGWSTPRSPAAQVPGDLRGNGTPKLGPARINKGQTGKNRPKH